MNNEWESNHKQLGFETERQMFQDLYVEQKMTIRELAKILGTGANTVRNHLVRCGIAARPRGGKNRLGMSRVRSLPDAVLEHPEKSARELGLHPSAIYKEKRRRKEEQTRASQSGTNPAVSERDVVGEQD